jgi:short-subunit dehydrogenase
VIFKDKTAIITGASEGIGAAAARKFADAGANLMLVARTKRNLEAIAEEITDRCKVRIFAMDVSDPTACVDLFKKSEFEFGRVDVLINNAGNHSRGLVESVSPDDLGRMIDVNLKAPIMLSRLALPYLREAGGGVIINVASIAGRTAVVGSATYSASKFGLRIFTFALAEELRGSGIRVAAISPGPVIDTDFIMANIDETNVINFSQPMSTAAEVAQAILDLCGNRQREISLPWSSGVLSTLGYIAPWLIRALRPMLMKKGERVKRELKAKARVADDDSGR